MNDPGTSYRVLARKYRPQSFAEVIGAFYVTGLLMLVLGATG